MLVCYLFVIVRSQNYNKKTEYPNNFFHFWFVLIVFQEECLISHPATILCVNPSSFSSAEYIARKSVCRGERVHALGYGASGACVQNQCRRATYVRRRKFCFPCRIFFFPRRQTMLLVVRDKEECCGEKRGIGLLARVHYTFIFYPTSSMLLLQLFDCERKR